MNENNINWNDWDEEEYNDEQYYSNRNHGHIINGTEYNYDKLMEYYLNGYRLKNNIT
jgi:hypothetical protein